MEKIKKLREWTHKHAIPAAFITFAVIEVILLGIGRLLSLLPKELPIKYFNEAILVLIPIAIVFFFGFSSAFKKGNFFKGLFLFLPYIVLQLIMIGIFFGKNIGNPETNWQPWYLILYGIISIICVAVREECIYRATIQNIVAKKHANSVKGVWITVIVSSIIFGLCHIFNIFFGVAPISVLTQVLSGFILGLLFGAIYLRSGSLWAIIFIHTLTDIVGLADSTFLSINDVENMNQLSISWGRIILYLIYIGFTIYLLRPSKCKQIYENFCFKDKKSEVDTLS